MTSNIKMGFKLFILSLACLSCLTPPALASIHVLKAAAAVGAVKGAALLGAGALAIKGAAIKGAAVGAVKGAAAKGAAILAAKGAAVKGALALAAKAANLTVQKLAAVRPPPVIVQQPAAIRFRVPTVIKARPPLPPVLSSLSSLWSSAHTAVQHKIDAVGNVIESLHPRPVVIEAEVAPPVISAPVVHAPVVYGIAEPQRFYPLIERVEADCL